MLRIGMIGTENSHITHFTRFLNVEQRHPGVRATALVGGRSERNLELAELGEIELIVDEPAELVGQVDAAIVSTRDGAKHLEHARPLLEAGTPVLVDKPLAASVEMHASCSRSPSGTPRCCCPARPCASCPRSGTSKPLEAPTRAARRVTCT